MFLSLIFNLAILIPSSISQNKLVIVKVLDDTSGASQAGGKIIQLVPTNFISNEDIPFSFKNSSTVGCLSDMSITKTSKGTKFLTFAIGDFDYSYVFNKKIEICNGSVCINPPKSTSGKYCPMDQLFETIKLAEIDDHFFMFARSCFKSQLSGQKYSGGFIYQELNKKFAEKDHQTVLNSFEFERSVNITYVHELSHFRSSCYEQCSDFFYNVSLYCKYIAVYDSEFELFVYIGVASTLFLSSVIISMFYYYYD